MENLIFAATFDEEVHVIRMAKFLQPKELLQFGMVNRTLLRASQAKELWEAHCKTWFPRASMLDPDASGAQSINESIVVSSLSDMLHDGPLTLEQLMVRHAAVGEAVVLRVMAANGVIL